MGRKGGGERFTLTCPGSFFLSFDGVVEPSRALLATLRRPTYSKQASRSGAEPRSVVHLGRRLIGMLRISNRLEHAGGDERRALWKHQPADEQVSLRTGRPIGCGGCALTLLSRVSRRSWVSRCNIFRSSENLQAASTSSS